MLAEPDSFVLVPLLLGAAVVAVALGAVLWLARRALEPLRLLRGAARELARGGAPDPGPLRAVDGPLRSMAVDLAQASERVREMHAQLDDETLNSRTILESLTEGVLIVDATQTIHSANAGLQRMFELKAPPLGRSVLEIFRHVELREAVAQAIAGEPTSRAITLETRGADGRYASKHFDLTAVGLRAPGASRPLGAIVVFHDITALKALESVRREFVANVSHELRTPLSIINGYVETLLEDGALDDRALATKALGTMRKHGERLNLLIEDLLTISRLEHGRGGLSLEPVAVRDAFQRVVERLDPMSPGRSVKIAWDIPEGLPRVQADPSRLDQILFNLLENALKYGPAKGLRILLAARADEKSVRLTISDNGPGIPPSDLPHIFERFYRVHKDRSRDAGGTGLGLSIVKHLAQAHGGKVWAESVVGEGAAFSVELSRAER